MIVLVMVREHPLGHFSRVPKDDGELKVWTSEGFERTMNALTRAGTE